jgi:hypothetical protein
VKYAGWLNVPPYGAPKRRRAKPPVARRPSAPSVGLSLNNRRL